MLSFFIFFFKQKTAYDMRISDWSSDVCSSDLGGATGVCGTGGAKGAARGGDDAGCDGGGARSLAELSQFDRASAAAAESNGARAALRTIRSRRGEAGGRGCAGRAGGSEAVAGRCTVRDETRETDVERCGWGGWRN